MQGSDDPVLIVGAGPVGLTAATELVRRGVPVRCVDRASAPSPLTKALVVWPRTMEVLRELGGSAMIAERGLPVESLLYFSDNRKIADVGFQANTKPVILPQPDVEELLGDAYRAVGGVVDRGVELLELADDGDGVTARLCLPEGGTQVERFSYVLGADGASSTVRTLLDIPFEGDTYPNTFVLADVRISGRLQHDASYYYCSPRGILVIVGLPGGRFRVFTSAPADLDRADIPLDLVQRLVDDRGPGGLTLHDPTWTSAFSVHTRHAGRVREGRMFLAGDAAHIHSPAGGQGLNTGVTDAHNLAWKLAMVWHGTARPILLDTYQPERQAVAKSVVRQADVQTKAWLLARRHQVVLRDAAVRVASALRVPDFAFTPWLAGLRNTYPVTGPAEYTRARAGFTPGALAPDRPVWDSRAHRRVGLRSTLDTMRYTLLFVGASETPSADVRSLLDWAEQSDVVDVRTLAEDKRLDEGYRTHRGGRRAAVVVLIRPDGYVDGCAPVGAAGLVRDRCATLFTPAARTTDLRLAS